MTLKQAAEIFPRLVEEHPTLAELPLEVACTEAPLNLEDTFSLAHISRRIPPGRFKGLHIPKHLHGEVLTLWGPGFYNRRTDTILKTITLRLD